MRVFFYLMAMLMCGFMILIAPPIFVLPLFGASVLLAFGALTDSET